MPVRRSRTSFRQLLRGSSYLSRLPTKCISSNRYLLTPRMHDSVERSPVVSTWHSMARRASSPIASSLARYASTSSFGYSMRAITSAACARPVPGAFAAAVRAATRSFRMSGLDQPIEHRQRQLLQAVDDELCARQFVSGIAVGDADAAETGALRRLQPPPRILDGDAAPRIERAGRRLEPRECQLVGRGRWLAPWRVARSD